MNLKFVLCFVISNCLDVQSFITISEVDLRLHVKFFEDDITVNGSDSTWAVGTTNVTLTHISKTDRKDVFGVTYYLLLADRSPRMRLCQYIVRGMKCSEGSKSVFCGSCSVINRTTEGTTEKILTSNILFPILDSTKNQSTIVYDHSPLVHERPLQKFTISECPVSVGRAQAVSQTDPCGYGCTSQFSCPSGYYSAAANSALYHCSPTTKWSPVPLCREETSTTLTTTTINTPSSSLSNSTSEADSTLLASQSSRLTSAALIAAIGIVFMITYTIIALYGWKNKFVLDNVATLFVAKGVCVVSWLIAVGLLFGLPGNNSAHVAGTIVGSLSLVGMIAILLLHLWKIKNQKGIPGKEVKL